GHDKTSSRPAARAPLHAQSPLTTWAIAACTLLPASGGMLGEEGGHATALDLQMFGPLPRIEPLDVRQQFRELRAGCRRVWGIVTGQHEAGNRAAPHERAADAENELAAPQVRPKGTDGPPVEV